MNLYGGSNMFRVFFVREIVLWQLYFDLVQTESNWSTYSFITSSRYTYFTGFMEPPGRNSTPESTGWTEIVSLLTLEFWSKNCTNLIDLKSGATKEMFPHLAARSPHDHQRHLRMVRFNVPVIHFYSPEIYFLLQTLLHVCTNILSFMRYRLPSIFVLYLI